MKSKKRLLSAIVFALVLATVLSVAALPASAIPAYKSGANGASPSYAAGKYYRHVMSIPLTGDGVTDVLAVALSQLGYSESANNNSLGGVANGWGNHTEYNWNMGDIEGDGYEMEWCAAFCSWALLQGGATTHNSFNDACRKHPNDPNYIWREVGCPPWVQSLKNAGLYSLRGSYTPKSGDLIFFNRGNTVGHIGLVVWCDGATVYTIEGNTSDSAGVEGNGGGVYYKSYPLNHSGINGYGRLPYKSNPDVPKVDYSGRNKTAGLYITKSAFKVSPPVDAGHPVYEEVYTIPKYEMFTVSGFTRGTDGVDYAVVQHGAGTYYAKLNSNVLQMTASGHVHNYGFTYDATHHMDRCECDSRINVVPHDFKPSYDSNEHFLQCSCGYKKPKSYGTHNFNTYSADDTTHIKACECGCPDPNATRTQHVFNIPVTEGQTTYYRCECGAEQRNGSVHFHEYGFTYDATYHMDRCECGARINEVEHDFQPAYDDKEHFLQCSCGYKKPKSYGKHELSYVKTSDKHYLACSCGYVSPGSEAGHSYGFTYDATHHMDRCECDSRINVVAHNFSPAYDGKEHFLQCSCGYKKPKSYGAHEYTSYVATVNGHTRACSCGYADPTASEVPHDFKLVSENYYLCECGAEKKNGTVHAHSYGFTYDAENHMYRCDCDSRINLVPHDFNTVYNENEHYLQCWCGFIKHRSNEAHVYDTYALEEDRHIKACACGCPEPDAVAEEHKYDIITKDDTAHYYSCECGAINDAASDDHDFKYESHSDNLHKGICEECGETNYETHVFDRNNNTECICGKIKTTVNDPSDSDPSDSDPEDPTADGSENGNTPNQTPDSSGGGSNHSTLKVVAIVMAILGALSIAVLVIVIVKKKKR